MLAATKLCLSRENIFAATTCLSRRNFRRNKRHVFVATKVKHVCLDKYLLRQAFCRDKNTYVARSMLLSRQTRVCRNKTFVPPIIQWKRDFVEAGHVGLQSNGTRVLLKVVSRA